MAMLDTTRNNNPALRHRLRYLAQDTAFSVNVRESYLVAWLILAGFVIPNDFSLPMGGGVTMLRVLLFAATAPMILALARKMRTGGYVFVMSDAFVLLTGAWMIGSIVVHLGPKGFISLAGINGFELIFAYFCARTFFGTPAGLSQFVRVLRIAVLCVIALALVDTVSGTNVIGKIAGSATPQYEVNGVASTTVAYRMGIVRARGPIEHPILLGMFLLTSVALFFASTRNQTVRIQTMAMCVFGMILTLSSAPFLGLGLLIAIVVLNRVFKHVDGRWTAFAFIAACAIVMLFIFADDPLRMLINNLTFDPTTGFFRIMIWEWVGINLQQSPWIGIGMNDWMRGDEMPPSVDSLWLVQALRYGYPAAILLGISILSTLVALPIHARRRFPSMRLSIARLGVTLILFVLALMAFTVHYWGTAWVMLALIMGMTAGLAEAAYLPPAQRADDRIHHPSFFWRSLDPA